MELVASSKQVNYTKESEANISSGAVEAQERGNSDAVLEGSLLRSRLGKCDLLANSFTFSTMISTCLACPMIKGLQVNCEGVIEARKTGTAS